jgi:hypothetical protein
MLRPYKEYAEDMLAGVVVSGGQLVFVDLAAERVAVNAEDLRGAGLVAVGALQDALDETLLELAHGLIEQDAPVHHLCDKPFELIFHDRTLRGVYFNMFWARLRL